MLSLFPLFTVCFFCRKTDRNPERMYGPRQITRNRASNLSLDLLCLQSLEGKDVPTWNPEKRDIFI